MEAGNSSRASPARGLRPALRAAASGPRLWARRSPFRLAAARVCALVAITGGAILLSAPIPINCGDGRVDLIVEPLDTPLTYCCTAHPTIPPPALSTVAGCSGNALAIDYDLRNVAPPGAANEGQSWVVLVRDFSPAKDLSAYSHLRFALRGSNPDSHETLEVKLRNPGGLFTASLRSMTDLPAWRAIYLDFREFTGNGTIDLTNVTGLEIGITRCDGCEVADNPAVPLPPDEHTGTLFLDEIAVVDLEPGGAYRVVHGAFEPVTPNPAARAAAAQAILARVAAGGPGQALVPAWFPETSPNFNSYAQAEALLVFAAEYGITGDIRFRDAARRLAAKMVALQIGAGAAVPSEAHAGAWYSAYTIDGGTLRPPGRASAPVACDGTETLLHDIDTCAWIGNVGWMLIALFRLEQAGFHDNPPALAVAINRGANWIARQFGRHAGHPDLVSLGTEGNTSAYFGLLSALRFADAARLGAALGTAAWDPVQRRVKTGVGPADASSAIDVAGSWGATLLLALGRRADALASQGYAASIFGVHSFDESNLRLWRHCRPVHADGGVRRAGRGRGDEGREPGDAAHRRAAGAGRPAVRRRAARRRGSLVRRPAHAVGDDDGRRVADRVGVLRLDRGSAARIPEAGARERDRRWEPHHAVVAAAAREARGRVARSRPGRRPV